jgi:hypothetical protein
MVAGLLGLGILGLGCGQSKPLGTVRGTVHFRGAPVTNGIVMLYSAEVGYGNQRDINPDGSFAVDALPYGRYQIAVGPPMVMEEYGGKSAPTLRVIEVDNIPKRYHNPSTSGFSCDVAGPSVTIALRME